MDPIADIGVFVRVVESRSFSRAGERLGLTPSGVSRAVSRLEEKLGVRLLNRTTRSLSLTDEGAIYHERCSKILSELADADSAIARSRTVPRGRLRVDSPLVLGEFVLGPALPRFLEKYPELSLDLSLRDHLIDPTAEGIDVVLRLADLNESDLVAKRLGTARRVTAGAPAYFKQHGRPKTITDLRKHRLIPYLMSGTPTPWKFSSPSGEVTVGVTGRLHTNSGANLRVAAVAGLGIIQVFEQHIAAELKRGTLEVVLADQEPPLRPVVALYDRPKGTLPKVRVFLDFVAELFGPRR